MLCRGRKDAYWNVRTFANAANVKTIIRNKRFPKGYKIKTIQQADSSDAPL